MYKRARIVIVAAILAASAFISGCGLLKGKEKVDPPKEVSYLKDGEELETATEEKAAGEKSADTVMRDLYLIDRNGLVVSQTLPLPKTESAAKQVLEHLVADGPVTEMLPNGFRTVLPANTTVDVDIKDGKAVVDLSEEFATYEAKDETKIMQAITWTLTQFDSVQTVELRMNGTQLTEMPVGGTPINIEGTSRADGINLDDAGVADITNTRPVTVYYLSQADEDYYFVPVTKRVANQNADTVSAVIHELAAGPGMNTNLISGLNSDAKLLEEAKIEDGVVTLNFNEAILGSSDQQVISDETLQSLVLSLTEQAEIEGVSVQVNGNTEIVNEQGEALTAPVTRPEKINAGSF